MIDDRIKNLINGAMDGELTDAELAEMDQHLAQSDEARRYLAGMADLDAYLKKLPEQAMPDELHTEILRNIELPVQSATVPSNAREWPGLFRYGFAAAAGLLLAVGIYQFGSESIAPGDFDQLVGTMAPGAAVELDSLSIETDELRSTASLERRQETMILNIQLDSAEPIELSVDFEGTSLDFQTTLEEQQSDLQVFEGGTSEVRVISQGQQKFAVFWHRADTASDQEGAITLEYSSDGTLIQQGTLVPRW